MTKDFLGTIIEVKRARVEAAKQQIPEPRLRKETIAVRHSAESHALLSALNKNGGIKVIAEFKRKSPSKGVIRNEVCATDMARLYESGGARAISILTEEDYFDGSLDDLRSVRNAVSLPILRKDFIFQEYQIYESAAAGADALLLIAAALDDQTLRRLRQITEEELSMDALVEVHTKEEMSRAVASGANLIGVNNRNLKSFEVSLETSSELAREPTGGALLVSESGLNTSADLHRLRDLGYTGFLIGESLMRAGRPDEVLRTLIGG